MARYRKKEIPENSKPAAVEASDLLTPAEQESLRQDSIRALRNIRKYLQQNPIFGPAQKSQ